MLVDQIKEIAANQLKIFEAGAASVKPDAELSTESENPVQNKVIYEALKDKLNFPTQGQYGGTIRLSAIDPDGKTQRWIVENPVYIYNVKNEALNQVIPSYKEVGRSFIQTNEQLAQIPNTIFVATPQLDYEASNKKYVDDRFSGSNKAVSFNSYQEMISVLNTLVSNEYHIGQNIMIVTLEVPDLWVSSIDESNITYTYTTDEDFANALKTNGSVQVGFYVLSALETQKVDLTEYAEKEYVDDTFVGKTTKAYQVYCTDGNGGQVTRTCAWNATSSFIPMYDDNRGSGGYNNEGEFITTTTGALITGIPFYPKHATPKKWVEDNFVKVLKGEGNPTAETVGDLGQFYINTTTGETYQYKPTSESDTKPWKIMINASNFSDGYGIKLSNINRVTFVDAPGKYIDERNTALMAVTCNKINYAVMKGLTEPTVGSVPVVWTEEQKALARQTIGATASYKHTVKFDFTCGEMDGDSPMQDTGYIVFYATEQNLNCKVVGDEEWGYLTLTNAKNVIGHPSLITHHSEDWESSIMVLKNENDNIFGATNHRICCGTWFDGLTLVENSEQIIIEEA